MGGLPEGEKRDSWIYSAKERGQHWWLQIATYKRAHLQKLMVEKPLRKKAYGEKLTGEKLDSSGETWASTQAWRVGERKGVGSKAEMPERSLPGEAVRGKKEISGGGTSPKSRDDYCLLRSAGTRRDGRSRRG